MHNNENLFDDDIIRHLMSDLSDFIEKFSEFRKAFKKNYDPREKKIGDRVKVWNYLSLTDYEGKSVNPSTKSYVKTDFYVVTENCSNKPFFYQSTSDCKIPQDLVIVNPKTCVYYRVNSADVCLIE